MLHSHYMLHMLHSQSFSPSSSLFCLRGFNAAVNSNLLRAAASVASYLAPFLEFFVGVPFCLPTSHAVIDLVSAAGDLES